MAKEAIRVLSKMGMTGFVYLYCKQTQCFVFAHAQSNETAECSRLRSFLIRFYTRKRTHQLFRCLIHNVCLLERCCVFAISRNTSVCSIDFRTAQLNGCSNTPPNLDLVCAPRYNNHTQNAAVYSFLHASIICTLVFLVTLQAPGEASSSRKIDDRSPADIAVRINDASDN